MTDPQAIVLVDSREAVSGKKTGGSKIVEGLKKYAHIKVLVQNLGNAIDYAIPVPTTDNHYLIIQRKTSFEMLNHNAIFNDVKELKEREKENGDQPYLLIEGALTWPLKFAKHYRPELIIGILNSLIDKWKIKVVQVPIQYWTILWLAAKAKEMVTDKVHGPIYLGEKDMSLPKHEMARKILESCPLISTTYSTRILQKYGTLKNAFENMTEWSDTIERLGKKRVDGIVEVFNVDYNKASGDTKK